VIARFFLAVTLLACLACVAGPAQAEVFAARTPVVFILFDELPITSLETPQGALDTSRFPGFAEFASTSTWFPNMTTVADGTRWAAPSALSGVYPRKSKMAAWFDYPTNLMAWFAPTHRVHALETVTRLCPPAECGDPVVGRTRTAQSNYLTNLIPAAKRYAAHHSPLAQFIRGIRPWHGGPPPLYYAHALLPHTPWVWLPTGQHYPLPSPALPGLGPANQWMGDQSLVDQGWKRHLLQVGYADLLLRRLISRLKRVGLWDRSLVAFTADHGVAFYAGHSRRTSTSVNIGGIAPTPFFVKAPGQHRARRVEAHAESVDILPTVFDALDESPPPGIDGRSAFDPDFQSRPVLSLWHTTSISGFGKRTYPLSLFFRRRRLVVTRQFVRFGSGPLTGPFWHSPYAPARR
jgi:sulfatase-like protein